QYGNCGHQTIFMHSYSQGHVCLNLAPNKLQNRYFRSIIPLHLGISDANVLHYQPKLVLGLAGYLLEPPSEGRGQRFESSQVRHNLICYATPI
mgnify:CR=1